MYQWRSSWLSCLGGLLLWFGFVAGVSASDVRAVIEASNADFSTALNEGKLARVVSLFSDDGEVLPPNSERVQGKAAITEFWRGMIAKGLTVRLTTEEVVQFGDYAYELGYYFLRTAQGEPQDEGKYIVIWRQEQGTWKMYRDIFNSNIERPDKTSG